MYLKLTQDCKLTIVVLLLFSRLVVSSSLQPQGLQHARPLCPSPFPKVFPSSWPLHRWCHSAMSSSDALFSFCPQSFPESGTFPIVGCYQQVMLKVMLKVRSCLKSCMLGFSIMWTKNFQTSKLCLEKAEGIKLPTFAGSQKKLTMPSCKTTK